MSTLLLLRHGQAAFGADLYDSLSDTGALQAEKAGQYFSARSSRFDQIVVGPRIRHEKTAAIACESAMLEQPRSCDARLDEFAEGQQILAAAEKQQGVCLTGAKAVKGKQAARHYAAQIQCWASGEADIPGVDGPDEFRRRVSSWKNDLTGQCVAGQTVLVVTSGGVIAALVAESLDLPNRSLSQLMSVIYNASLTEFAFSANRPISLVNFNVASFLPGNLLTRV